MNKIKIQEVSAPGCAHCAKAKEVLEGEIKSQFPNVEFEYIEMMSEEGQKMVQEYAIMSSPGCLELSNSKLLIKNRSFERFFLFYSLSIL